VKSKVCPACTNKFTRGRTAHVLAGGQLVATVVCSDCAGNGLLFVIPSTTASARAITVSLVSHLRKLAKAYELNDDGRAIGLRQAADILESGRAVEAVTTAAPTRVEKPIRTVELVPEAKPSKKSITALLDCTNLNGALSKADRRILSAVAHGSASRKKVAIVSGYSARSGGFASALASLRARGYLASEAGEFSATREGLKALGPIEALPKGPALISYWVERLSPCEGTILQRLVAAYPNRVDRHTLGEETGYSENSGGFASALAKLRTLELVDGYRASPELMQ
jgi:hypothetical protein